MVSRKSSLPYPAAAPSPLPGQSHLDVDSTDIPPLPNFTSRTQAMDYQEMGNPWNDVHSSPIQAERGVPTSLKVGPGEQHQSSNKISITDLPDVLRPGWSGEATPRSSLDSGGSPERDWWDDDADGEEDDKNKDKHPGEIAPEEDGFVTIPKKEEVPEPLQVKRKPIGGSSPMFSQQAVTNPELASNNPFRRQSENKQQVSTDFPNWGSEGKGKGKEADAEPLKNHPPVDHFNALSLSQQDTNRNYQAGFGLPPAPQAAPPPIPTINSPFTEQPPLIPVSPKLEHNLNPWSSQSSFGGTASPMPFDPSKKFVTASSDDLLDRGQHEGTVLLGDELKALPNAPNAPTPSGSQQSFLSYDDRQVPPQRKPQRQESEEMYEPPPGPPPPTKPPRPAVVTGVQSEKEFAQMLEQRNETYAIKHFDWFDQRSGKMRRSSMLTQNMNGPCPLLALVNALILGAQEDTQAALDDALRQREQVSLGLIVETLMDELLSRALQTSGSELPDVDELNRFLMKLRTGMNANPRFVPPPIPAPNLMDAESPTEILSDPQTTIRAGTFESTSDIRLYGAFNVKLVHGWLPRPGDEAATAFGRSAQTYEDAQAVQFGEEELEYKLSQSGLTQQEQQVWEDITSIKTFLRAFPTQLTPYGLDSVKTTLQKGEFAILFRNDHFSTIYKYPQDGRLYTLITDAGYADRAEVIWESLVDINGARSEFYSGDFKSVSHGDSAHPMPHSQTDAANPGRSSSFPNVSAPNQLPLSPQEQQEQHDADFAMALQLQEEEEQRMRQERASSQSNASNQNNQNNQSNRGNRRGAGRRSTGNIPIPLRGNNSSSQELRPAIPPRNGPPRNQGVNRPADANQEDAPPAYEEAAKSTPYVPPVGSPLHPASSADARPSSSNLTVNNSNANVANSAAPGYASGNTRQRSRSTAYLDSQPSPYAPQLTPDYSARQPRPLPGAWNDPIMNDPYSLPRRDRERDCIVM